MQENRHLEEVSFRAKEDRRTIEMKQKRKCPFFRRPERLSIGIGYCDINSISTMCEGDFILCEKPIDLKGRLRRRLEESITGQASLWELILG